MNMLKESKIFPIKSVKFLYLASLLLFISACNNDQSEQQASEPDNTADRYDIVLNNGRVMDPESNLDVISNVGIRDGKIEIITENTLVGDREIDVTGQVVSPGFIDLHTHGDEEESYIASLRDGVTSIFDIEFGTADVANWVQVMQSLKVASLIMLSSSSA